MLVASPSATPALALVLDAAASAAHGGSAEDAASSAAAELDALDATLEADWQSLRSLHEAILSAQASSDFERGEYVRAAKLWAKTRVPLEQVALRFHAAGLLTPLKVTHQTVSRSQQQ